MKADEIKVGGYQLLMTLLLSINFITVAMSHALSIFYKYTPKFYCPESSGVSPEDVANVSNRTYGCVAVGTSCPNGYLFEFASSNSQLQQYYDGKHYYERSVVTEWQLICERAHLLRSLGELYFAGLLLGGLIFGFLADRLGRLLVLAVCLYAQGVMAVGLNVVENFQLFLVFRGLQGFFMQGLESCTFILCMELFPAKYRTLVASVILSVRSLGLALISGFSYFNPDWRILQLISCVPTAITVFYIWLIPESPRWLIAKGKTIDAELLIERISKYNSLLGLCANKTRVKSETKAKRINDDAKCADLEKSLHESLNLLSTVGQEESITVRVEEKKDVIIEKKNKLPSNVNTQDVSKKARAGTEKGSSNDKATENNMAPVYMLVSDENLYNGKVNRQSNQSGGLIGFLKRRFIGRTCVLLMFAWFASSVAFHSLVSMPQRLSSERHISLSLAALMEICTFALSYILSTSRCGRRWTLSTGQILGGTVCVIIAVVTLNTDPQLSVRWLVITKMALVVIGRIVNIISFFILRLVMIELLPTTSRATGVGLCIGAEMMGGLLMPFLLKLNRFVPELGRIVIGLICICSGLLVLSFPETLHTILPDTAEEARRLVQKRKNVTNDVEDNEHQTTSSENSSGNDNNKTCIGSRKYKNDCYEVDERQSSRC